MAKKGTRVLVKMKEHRERAHVLHAEESSQ